ncbi:methylenetetrahydrofolate reductase C-terminal domain-containing protein, partial [Thermodesulfobacteriota bacterium]
SCVTVCRSGGEKEARELARQLAHPQYYKNRPPVFSVNTVERQCERDLVETYLDVPDGLDAILSMACGVGVQILSDIYEPLPVFPALNTTFMGGVVEPGVWQEKCRGCGDCVLSHTGGICPVSRCAKSLFNGPCGGSQGGSCEVDPALPCAWALIFYRLKKQNKLHLLQTTMAPRDWQPAGSNGPRTRQRKGVG